MATGRRSIGQTSLSIVISPWRKIADKWKARALSENLSLVIYDSEEKNLISSFGEFQVSEILVKLAVLLPRKKEANQIMVSTLPELQNGLKAFVSFLYFSDKLWKASEERKITIRNNKMVLWWYFLVIFKNQFWSYYSYSLLCFGPNLGSQSF